MHVNSKIAIAKLHYITPNNVDRYDISEVVEKSCKEGVDWIQLRIKNQSHELFKRIAINIKDICKNFSAKLIINDNVQIAKEIQADGVHLGKEDMNPLEARSILGDDFIIGGTANTLSEILQLSRLEVDYIGLGPFRYTETKKNLSPVLGIEGIKKIMQRCSVDIPIIAVGGIQIEDIENILKTSVYGVAISSAINISSAKPFVNKIKNIK